MKKFLLILSLSLLSFLSSNSQNLGQINENNVLKIEYVQHENGKHVFKIINKVNCMTQIKVERYDNQFSDHTIQANDYLLLEVNSPQSTLAKIKAKKTNGSECHPNPDDGWVEMISLLVLPTSFQKTFSYCLNMDRTIDLQFTVDQVSNIKSYNIKYSSDAKTFRTVQTITANKVSGIQTYKTKLK